MNYFGVDIHSTYHKVVGLTASGDALEFDIPNTREGRERLQEVVLRFPKRGRKNDRIDASLLCEAARMDLDGIWVPDELIRQRRALASKRVSFTQRRTQSMNSLKAAFREYHIQLAKDPWSKAGLKILATRIQELPETIALGANLELNAIEFYNQAIDELDRRMAGLACDDDNIRLLMSIAGISYYSGFVIMSEIGCIERFSSAKQLVGYAGLAPRLSQSGKTQPRLGPISKGGRSRLRWMVVECANSASRYNAKIQKLYWRVKKRSGNANKAKVAAGRKLLTLCYHILKTGQPYSEVEPDKYEVKLRKMGRRGGERKAA